MWSNLLQLGVIAPGILISEGTAELIGVPPGASVIGTLTTVIVVVIVGIAITTVEPDFTKVSDFAVVGG
jgi:hypothetical protein